MARKKLTTRIRRTRKSEMNVFGVYDKAAIPKKYQDVSSVLLLFIIQVIFMNSIYIFSKEVSSPDSALVTALSNSTELNEGQGSFWNRYMFSGTPKSFTGGYPRGGINLFMDLVNLVVFSVPNALGNNSIRLVLYCLIFAIGVYVLLRVFQFSAFQAFLASVGAVFSINYIVWLLAWHATKCAVVMTLPWTVAFLEIIRSSKSTKSALGGLVGLLVFLWLAIEYFHVQMLFYLGIVWGIYFLKVLIDCFLKQESWKSFQKTVLLFLTAFAIGIMAKTDKYLSVLEYTPYSIRGAPSILTTNPELKDPVLGLSSSEKKSNSLSSRDGVDYSYATSWSFPVEEIINLVVPSYFGYGGQSYWGQMPFVLAPFFVGCIFLLLAILGAARFYKERFVIILISTFIISFLISFGKHFSLIYDLFYNYVPFFSKFRVPSMILILAEFCILLLAAYGVRAIYEWRENLSPKVLKNLKIGLMISLGIGILIIIASSEYKEIYLDQISESNFGKRIISQYGKSHPNPIRQVDAQLGMFSKMRADLIISVILIVSLVGVVYMYVTQKLAKMIFQVVLVGLVIVDLSRAVSPLLAELKKPTPKANRTKQTVPGYIDFIKKDTTQYRVLPYVSSPTSSYFVSQKVEIVSGYHPAKLRIYQDLMDLYADGVTQVPSFFKNPLIMEMLNVKYLIIDKPSFLEGFETVFKGKKVVLANYNNNKRYWFVDSVRQSDYITIVKAIEKQSFNVKEMAFVEKSPQIKIQKPDSLSSIKLVSYNAHKAILDVNASSGNHFLFIGEIFYPNGWKCYIDGKPVEIFKTNYAFRGIFVPKGKHKIKMVYEEKIYYFGKKLKAVANVLLFLLMAIFGTVYAYDKIKKRRISKDTEKKST